MLRPPSHDTLAPLSHRPESRLSDVGPVRLPYVQKHTQRPSASNQARRLKVTPCVYARNELHVQASAYKASRVALWAGATGTAFVALSLSPGSVVRNAALALPATWLATGLVAKLMDMNLHKELGGF